jgi:hypothetical protein
MWYPFARAEGAEAERYTTWLCNPISILLPNVEDCDRAMESLAKVRDGSVPSVKIEGNDTTVTASLGKVQVDIELDEGWVGRPDGQFSFAEFSVALESWRRLLTLPHSAQSNFTVQLPGHKSEEQEM